MNFLFGHDAEVADFVCEALQIGRPEKFTAIGFVRPGKGLIGGAIFHNWNGSNIEITMVCPGCSRGVIRAVFAYVFVQLQANRLTAFAKRSNARSWRNLLKTGFVKEAELPRYYGPSSDDDAFVLRMDREAALAHWIGD